MVIACAVLAGLVLLFSLLFISLMAAAAVRQPPADATVVVLGAQIRQDQPSRMLRDRLDTAADYLQEHPEARCVVSGGQGPDEDYTEAYVMEKYLVEQRGIDPIRIAREERSTSTRENMLFSMEIIRDRGWSPRLAIATQEFHQFRGAVMARRAGAEAVGALTCGSPFHLLLCYWVRECAAICRVWILGY